MRFPVVMLANAAAVKDNTLTVEGGGVQQVNAAGYPARLDCALAGIAECGSVDQGSRVVEIRVLERFNPEPLATLSGLIEVQEMGLDDYTNMPFAIPLATIALPGPGQFVVELLVDGLSIEAMAFTAGIVTEADRAGL